jgi:hypothetical protein
MKWKGLLIDGYNRLPEFLENVLKGLAKDDLDWQPKHDCNSIGWLVWHLTRQQDAQISSLMGKEQLWIADEWYGKFNRQPDPDDTGFGDTAEQVAAFRSPETRTLLEYNRAAVERSKLYISDLSETDLDRTLDEPWLHPLPTVGVRLVSILDDSVLHAGQAAYVRGLRHGKGWQDY